MILYKRVLEAYNSLYGALAAFRTSKAARSSTVIEHTNQALYLREMTNRLDDLRREFKKEQDIQEKITAIKHTQAFMQGNADEKIRTDLCTAAPYTKVSVSPPKRLDARGEITNDYYLLMSHLMVPPQLIEHDVVRPNYSGMTLYCTRLAEGGWPLPEGVSPSKEHTLYGLKMRKKAGVDLVAAAQKEVDKESDYMFGHLKSEAAQ